MLTQGTLSNQNTITIEGPRRAYARFGHAMTGVGDVNADGFQGEYIRMYVTHTHIHTHTHILT